MAVLPEGTTALVRADDGSWLRFDHPTCLVQARRVADVAPTITQVEALARGAGVHAVGYVAYEAGAAFGLQVRADEAAGLPLVWFALFEPDAVTRIATVDLGDGPPAADQRPHYDLSPLTPSIDETDYTRAFARIKAHLGAGDTYQVNYTFRLQGQFAGDVTALFADLVTAQEGRYAIFLQLGTHSICSASPELFFSRRAGRLSARPMKGTMRRGRTLDEDRRCRDVLRTSAKQQAENVMIVDLVRNDLGRIAEVGSVEVPDLFTLERYPHVWQMTTHVTARSSASLHDIFRALHPSASVTGAPKIRTMELLRALEPHPRSVYTGALGHVWPGGDAVFNVAIRTAIVDHQAGTVQFGVGSGIVWDSEVAEEYAECLLKGAVLGRRVPGFELLETLRWTATDEFFLLDRHLGRLRDSAEYFGFAYREDAVREVLATAIVGAEGPLRVRLLVTRDGQARCHCSAVPPRPVPVRLRVAVAPIDPTDPFLFHKTTHRRVYDRTRLPNCDDVILWNPAGQITEATTANLVLALNHVLVTPPVTSGLLAGTFRAELLARGHVRERVLTLDDLRRAARVWLVNSVYEWQPATVV